MTTKKIARRTKSTKRPAEKPLARPGMTIDEALQARGVKVPETPLPEGEIKRAAARAAGIPPLRPEDIALDQARDEVVASIASDLRHASELTGALMASLVDCHDGTEDELRQLNAVLWRIRWNILLPAKAYKAYGDEQGEEVAS